MRTKKRLVAAILVLAALVAWGAVTPNATVAQDQLRTQDRLLTQTPGTCLPAPIKDQLQTRDRLNTSTPTALTATQPQVGTASGDTLKLRTKDQIRLNTGTGGGRH